MKSSFRLSVAGFVAVLLGVMLLASFSNEPASAGTPQPDAALDKGPSNQTVNFGDDITWTITVTNVGAGTVGPFTLEDTLPANGTGISWDLDAVGWDSCTPDPATTNFVCTRAETLNETESVTVTITGNSGDLAECPAGTQVALTNNAGVAASGDTNAGNDGDSAVATVVCPAAPEPEPDAALDKAPTNQTVNFGDDITWTITVTNVGTGDVGPFHLEDTLPANGTGISWDLDPVGWDSCTPDPATTNFVCDRAEVLHEGESITLTITGNSGDLETCPEGGIVELVNNAGVNADGDDNPLNDGDSAVATVNCPAAPEPEPDAALDKEPVNQTVNFGDPIEWTITVTNVGTGDVGPFHLEDTLPANGTGISWDIEEVGWDSCTPDPATTNFVCDRAEVLHEGESITLTITGNSGDLEECPAGTQVILVDNAGVDATGDDNPLNDGDSAVATVNCPAAAGADAALDKEPVNQTVNFGDLITWTITVSNVGTGDVGPFTLEDTLPANGAGISWDIDEVGWDTCAPDPATTNFVCERAETLHEGESVTVSITGNSGDLTECPEGEQVELVNNAGVIAVGDTNTGNDGDSAVATVVCPAAAGPDAALDKEPAAQTVDFGDPITWTITVSNVGSGDVGGFHLEDTLPANGTGISWDIEEVGWDVCAPDPATTNFTCDRAETLHEGESVTVTITGNSGDLEECPAGTQVILVDNAGVDATGDDNPLNDGDSAVATVNCPAAVADAALDKEPAAQTVDFGDPITWTITVSNVGSGDVGGFHLEDTLPANGTGISWDIEEVGWDVCAPDPATTNFTCDRAETLHEGESVTVTITGNSGDLEECPAGTQVILVDNAGVDATGDDNPSNDGDSAVATVNCPAAVADAALDKEPAAQTVDFGDPITWTITVSNVGSGDVGGFHLEDTLPANGTGISWDIEEVGWDVCAPDPATTNFTCDRAETLHEGESVTVTITGNSGDLEECPAGTQVILVDNAGVDATGDDNPLNDGDSAVATVNCPAAVADAALDKEPAAQTVDFGDPITWTITVSNVGSGDVGGFHLEDTLPANGTGISWDIEEVGWDVCAPDPATTNFTCDRAETLHEGESVTVTITGNSGDLEECPAGTQVILVDNAGVDATGDDNPSNDGDSAVATVNCPAAVADAALDKEPAAQTVDFGDPITWTITVSNVGSGDVGGFHLEDTLPANGTGISWDIEEVGWDVCAPDPATTNFTCDRAETLHEGESVTVTITGNSGDLEECPAGTQVILVDNAGVDATGDDNPSNDGDSAVATVNCPAAVADAALDKEPAAQTVDFGDPITWTITVSNVGSGDVGGFHLEDTLPANGTGISWDIEEVGWDVCAPDPATTNFTCDRAETLHEGESVTVTITGNSGDLEECPAGTQVILVDNAGVDATGDDNPANDGDSAVATVNCPAAVADAALDKEPAAQTVDFGDPITWTITVSNVGSGDVGGFHLEDTLPANGTGISWDIEEVGWDVCAPDPATTNFTCDRAETLHEGESVTVTITGNSGDLEECPAGTQVILVDNAGVDATGDDNPSNDGDSAVATVNCPAAVADAALDKEPAAQTVDFGDPITWTITVSNVGSGDVGGFHLEDTLPANGTGISWDIEEVGWDVCAPDPATTNFTCDRAETLHEGESVTVTITGNSGDLEECPAGTQVILVDNAGVDATGDDNPLNDGDSAVATVNCPAAVADAALDKEPAAQTVDFGDPITWTITVSNVGSGDVGGFHLEDTLPANGTGISWDIEEVGWDVCAPDPATTNFTCDRAETLHEGESVTVTITGNSGDLEECPAGTQVILVDNAGVDATGDDNPSNDGDSAVATVICPAVSGGAAGNGGSGPSGSTTPPPGQSTTGGVRVSTPGSTSNVVGVRSSSGAPRIDTGGSGVAGMDSDAAWHFALGAAMAAMVGASALGFRRAIS